MLITPVMQHVKSTGSQLCRWYAIFFCIGLAFYCQRASAQSQLIDSLKAHARKASSDTVRFNTYYDIANAFYKQGRSDFAELQIKPA